MRYKSRQSTSVSILKYRHQRASHHILLLTFHFLLFLVDGPQWSTMNCARWQLFYNCLVSVKYAMFLRPLIRILRLFNTDPYVSQIRDYPRIVSIFNRFDKHFRHSDEYCCHNFRQWNFYGKPVLKIYFETINLRELATDIETTKFNVSPLGGSMRFCADAIHLVRGCLLY